MTSAKERIIEATLTLVTEQGLSGITMVAVAKEAGVARATLYNHYPDVPSILADAAELHIQHAVDGLREALAVVSDPRDSIEQLVRHVAAISTHGHTLITHHGFPPELRDRLDAFDTELRARSARSSATAPPPAPSAPTSIWTSPLRCSATPSSGCPNSWPPTRSEHPPSSARPPPPSSPPSPIQRRRNR